MKIKRVIALAVILTGSSILAAGCSKAGQVTINDKTSSSSSRKLTASERSSERAQSKANSQSASQASAKARSESIGKTYTYGLPLGPSWLHIYTDGKETSGQFDPKQAGTVKLTEHAEFQVGGTLPLVGQLLTKKMSVDDSSSEATMDQSSKYDRNLTFILDSSSDGHFEHSFEALDNADNQAISKRAFTDLPKYLAALSTNDTSKLPNQSEALSGGLKSQNINDSVVAKYQVMKQFYNKESASNTNGSANHWTYVTIGGSKNSTEFAVQVYAKVKKTDVDQLTLRTDGYAKYGSTSTKIIEYQLLYQLTSDNKDWQLIQVTNDGESDYDMNDSSSQWITQTE